MFELYLFILTLAIGYYYETSVKESSHNKPLKIKQKILKIDKDNPYRLTLQKEIEIENISGIPCGG